METATQTLHRLTSYQPGRDWDEAIDDPRIVQDLEANDMSRLPWFIKQYAERAAVTPLPRELPVTTEPAVAVLAGTAEVKPSLLDLPNLSRLLYLSAGVVRIMERDFGIHPFRAAGSAGGRFPLELYVAVPSGGALPPGVHWYDPLEHVLVQVGPAWDCGRPVRGPDAAGPPVESVIAAFVAIAAADVGRLSDAEYRDAQLAAGLAEGRLHLAAYALGASASGMTFDDSQVPALLGEHIDGLLFTCVGVPRYPNAPAGPPGTPTRVRRVTPAS